ncbi:DsbA family protein [Pseudoalteromonas sp. SG45-5]|uniref:DsbA family protein n=1 Tax=unclassified Pseudoalteromonas TaxID=194690 RepID=UPI0015FA643B|nr:MULTISPECIES: DsbA family protein [unclassified Pseudoalteromonas]MBB1386072.1 DsbA family protein [Pseudoalteromonas sp. SG45-5]MBB1393867.1 DsbA family protein [Pseudoalteromonas sp. SG44-4]MBB1446083.1 DsbA family protein [Pseudoalteromonas sp. SG41-6]
MSNSKLIYVHDPMCSWCWGYAPTWLKLKAQLEDNIVVEYKVGGLAPDNQQPMPQNMKDMLESTWYKISAQLGTTFNHDFWRNCQPRRSTYPACRAALIARKSGKEVEMVAAIQHAYYLNAQNPSDECTLIDLAQQIGLNKAQFAEQLTSSAVNTELTQELALVRTLPIHGFPSLVLIHKNKAHPIEISYTDWQLSLAEINSILN